jgi:hypothetical protein
MTTATAKRFLLKVLNTRVESTSIRTWATSDHNLPIWVKITKGWMEKNTGSTEDMECRLGAYIVCVAMGA